MLPCKCAPRTSRGMCHHTNSCATRDRGVERKSKSTRRKCEMWLVCICVSETSVDGAALSKKFRSQSTAWTTKLKGQPLQSLSDRGPVAGTVPQHVSEFLASARQHKRGRQLHLSCQSQQCVAQRNSAYRPRTWRCVHNEHDVVQEQVSHCKHPTNTVRQHVCFGSAKEKCTCYKVQVLSMTASVE